MEGEGPPLIKDQTEKITSLTRQVGGNGFSDIQGEQFCEHQVKLTSECLEKLVKFCTEYEGDNEEEI